MTGRAYTTDQRNNSTQVCLSDPVILLGLPTEVWGKGPSLQLAALTNTVTEKPLREGRVYVGLQVTVHHQKSQGRKSRQKLKQRLGVWGSADYWLASFGLRGYFFLYSPDPPS